MTAQRAPAGLCCFMAAISRQCIFRRSYGHGFPEAHLYREGGMTDGPICEGLTFDDVLLLPGKSCVLPTDVDTTTHFARKLPLNIPLASSAMDTVTESRLAIAIARQGGIGLVHRNMPIDRQGEEIDRVKRSESGMIVDPVTISPDITLRQALAIMN